MKDPRDVALEDGRYSPEAFAFLFHALDRAVRVAGREDQQGPGRHVSGQELLEGMRLHGLETYGPLCGFVWRHWGIHSTRDWGNIVFLLVDAELLNRQEGDRVEDFENGFEFDDAFVRNYEPSLPREFRVQPASDEG